MFKINDKVVLNYTVSKVYTIADIRHDVVNFDGIRIVHTHIDLNLYNKLKYTYVNPNRLNHAR